MDIQTIIDVVKEKGSYVWNDSHYFGDNYKPHPTFAYQHSRLFEESVDYPDPPTFKCAVDLGLSDPFVIGDLQPIRAEQTL